MGEYLAVLGMGFTAVAIFFFVMAYKLYKPPIPRKKDADADREGEPMNEVEATGNIRNTTLPTVELVEDTSL